MIPSESFFLLLGRAAAPVHAGKQDVQGNGERKEGERGCRSAERGAAVDEERGVDAHGGGNNDEQQEDAGDPTDEGCQAEAAGSVLHGGEGNRRKRSVLLFRGSREWYFADAADVGTKTKKPINPLHRSAEPVYAASV